LSQLFRMNKPSFSEAWLFLRFLGFSLMYGQVSK